MDGERRGSWQIRTPWGFPLRVHPFSLAVVVGLPGVLALLEGPAAGLRALAVVGWALCAVLAHELGHALVALRRGLHVGSVQIGPLLNSASVEESPGPRSELLVALGGPGANLLLGSVSLLASRLPGETAPFWLLGAAIHAAMGGINLLPLFPLDGARVLRAGLGLRASWMSASRISAAVGAALVLAGAAASFATLPPDPLSWVLLSMVALGLLAAQAAAVRRAWTREGQLQAGEAPLPSDWRRLDPMTFDRRRKKCDSPTTEEEELSFRE